MRDLSNALFRLLKHLRRNRLSDSQRAVLTALLEGWTLKSHRTLDGQKAYRLRALTGEIVEVAESVVVSLVAAKLLQSNQKFPAATYLLTDRGRTSARKLTATAAEPLTANRFTDG